MPLRRVSLRAIAAGLASLALILAAALLASRPLFWAAAVIFCGSAVVEAFAFNRAVWQNRSYQSPDPHRLRLALHTTSLYSALVYAWGAAAMFLAYPIAGLPWQHGWQYGLGMAAVSAGMAVYLSRLGANDPRVSSERAINRAVWLAALQGIATAIGLIALLYSGKLVAPKVFWKADWAANIVFASGAVSLTGLSALIVVTHRALARGAS